jgi:hypothetical protein
MSSITIQVPDDLSERLAQLGDRLPEWLELSLRQPALPAQVYRYIVDFLASDPTAKELSEFGATLEMAARLRTLLEREAAGELTPAERTELDEYERIEHLIVMIKAGNLPSAANQSEPDPRSSRNP